MFETLMRLYDGGNGKLTESGLEKAVLKGWITEEQENEILATKKE